MQSSIPTHWSWFPSDRYGLFIHWGPYAQLGRGEQVLFREHMDHREYQDMACRWNPEHFDARLWAGTAKKSGFRYACLTARHHDGYCLWDTAYTDYSSAKQAPKRDFVKEFVDAFREAGFKIGLYYSWLDWRIPAYFDGPDVDPSGFARFREYTHNQVKELLSNYGAIDYFFFDGAWPRSAKELESAALVSEMRRLQPHILINNRLGADDPGDGEHADGGMGAGESRAMGDFGTPEQQISADTARLWESCQVSTWRLWGWAAGERWKSDAQILDMLCECAHKGGNMILNVGPQGDGQFPPEFAERALSVGRWLDVHGEAVYGVQAGDLTEFVTHGWQTRKGRCVYLIFRFWDGRPQLRIPDFITPLLRAELMTTGQSLDFQQSGEVIELFGLPAENPSHLFPVIKLEFADEPSVNQWGRERLWGGNPARISDWSRQRGTSVYVDGEATPHDSVRAKSNLS